MDALADGLKALERRFGRVQFETVEIACSQKDQYREEMGESLQRRLFSFERTFPRDALAEIKDVCHKIEPQFADVVGDYVFRTVNIDPGIVTPDQIVTASHREHSHRLYLGEGVFAQVELIWSRGLYHRLPWTNPDYCEGEAIEFFQRIRGSFEAIAEHEQLASG